MFRPSRHADLHSDDVSRHVHKWCAPTRASIMTGRYVQYPRIILCFASLIFACYESLHLYHIFEPTQWLQAHVHTPSYTSFLQCNDVQQQAAAPPRDGSEAILLSSAAPRCPSRLHVHPRNVTHRWLQDAHAGEVAPRILGRTLHPYRQR